MSKRDIQTVCTLAAHLAQRQEHIVTGIMEYEDYIKKPAECAADAMTLQRLGRRARNNEVKRCNVPGYYWEDAGDSRPSKDCKYQAEFTRIALRVRELLKPYGLRASLGGDPRGCCLHVLGLPGNTWGGKEEGFGI